MLTSSVGLSPPVLKPASNAIGVKSPLQNLITNYELRITNYKLFNNLLPLKVLSELNSRLSHPIEENNIIYLLAYVSSLRAISF
jgi:hypothetical protein